MAAPLPLEPSAPTTDRRPGPVTIFVVSDSSGETAAHVMQAALAQFQSRIAHLQRFPQIRSAEQLIQIVADAVKCEALIAYTLVLPEFREALAREALRWNVNCLDLLGPLISKIAELTQSAPLSMPGRLHVLDEAYFKRMEAVNFAVNFDDGTQPERLQEADVVLIGLSRSSKTPNCLYLAQHYGLKAANVPLVPEIPYPQTLRQIPSNKMFGLAIDPHVLHGLRTSRAQVMGINKSQNYASLDRLEDEVRYARRVFRELKCQIIDVSSRAIEETSSEIALRLSRSTHPDLIGGKL